MTPPRTIRSATRRLVGLTALRWLPVGITTPVTVLLAQAQGLSLAEIGVLFTVHGIVVVALELPTGGLADVLGRRPVVVAGAVLHLASCLAFAIATSFSGFLVGVLLLGVGRALDSGPVEAWYVDTVSRIDPAADVAPGLARHSAADGGGLAVGAVAGGLLPGLLGGGADALAWPYALAAGLDLFFLAAVLRLLTEDPPPRQGSVGGALAAGARELPRTLAGAVRLSVTDGPMRVVLLLTAVGGVGLVGCELLGPVRFADLAGSSDDGAAVHGSVLAISFGAAAAGAMAVPALRRWLRGSTGAACAVLAGVGALALATLAGPDVLAIAATGFALYFVAHGASWPLLSAVLHTRVTAVHRATAVSAMSLAMALGGIAGNLAVPPLVAVAGLEAGFLAVAAVVALGVLGCLRLPRSTVADPAVAPGKATVGY